MRLSELPNIGPVLEKNLKAVGLDSPEALREVGAEDAWLKIKRQVDTRACLHQLQALAGAVEGVPKKELSSERKTELRSFFDSHK